jgi:hypothetical protein
MMTVRFLSTLVCLTFLVFSVRLVHAQAVIGPPVLVKDINTTPDSAASSSPSNFIIVR